MKEIQNLIHGMDVKIFDKNLVRPYFDKHFSECFSIIRFLSLFFDKEELKCVINDFIDTLWQN